MKSYKELLARTDAPAGSAWGLHGPDDDVGTLNFLSPEALVAATRLVKKGITFNLDCALDAFRLPHRPPLKHVILGGKGQNGRDDYMDSFYLQASSQVDGLRHQRHPIHGFYNFTSDDDITLGTRRLGVQRYAEHGIAGRGVLLDLDGHLAKQGKQLDHIRCESFTTTLLDEIAEAQKVSFKPGDILMINTGWLNAYQNEMPKEHIEQLTKRVSASGLVQSHESLGWLWDHQFSVCASDTPGFEAVPPAPDSPFVKDYVNHPEVKAFSAKMMHPYLIGLLGICLGELWDMRKLAADCAADGVYEFLLTCKPLNLVGGIGSPANAMAIK
jgi:kynurenine formamidase